MDEGKFPKPVNVAFVLPGLEPGGTEKIVRELAARLDRRRFRPAVVSVTGRNALAAEFRALGVPVHLLPYPGAGGDGRGASGPGGRVGFLLRLRALFRDERIGIVHSWLPLANIVGSFAAALAGTPVRIVSKRALCRYKAGHPVYSLFEDAANLVSDAVTVNSEAVASDVRAHERFLRGKVRLIRNGVALPAGAPPAIGTLVPELSGQDVSAVVACVANFHRCKGHAELIAAARTVVDAFPGARFALAGADAGEMGAARRQVEELGLSRHALFLGGRPDAAAIVAASTFLVHPSLEEGFSNAILEAMAAGKAVVAARVGGNPEAVDDGRTGLLVPPGDADALAAAILSLLNDPGRARQMGERARRRAEQEFAPDRMTREVEELYDGLLAARGAGGPRR